MKLINEDFEATKLGLVKKFRFNCMIVNMLQFRVLHFGRG